jgi:hypothetical protein
MKSTDPQPLYVLIFRERSPDMYRRLSPEERQHLLNEWNQWFEGLVAKRKMVRGHPLEPEARIVSGAGVRVLDEPFAETKEAIGGFFLLAVRDIEEATDVARQCPSLDFGIEVEVRPVSDLCPLMRYDAEQITLDGRTGPAE